MAVSVNYNHLLKKLGSEVPWKQLTPAISGFHGGGLVK
jgi:hypothetical protein